MMVYSFITVLTFLWYAGNVPVSLALDLRFQDGFSLRLGAGIFNNSRIRTWTLTGRPALKAGFSRFGKPPAPALKLAKWFLQSVRVDSLRLRASLGDACVTALFCGATAALLHALRLPGRVAPDFSQPQARVAAVCILSFRVGKGILAAAGIAAIYLGWRLKTWTSGQLKALCKRRWSPFGTWWT